jgi:uncharacterized protein YxjI
MALFDRGGNIAVGTHRYRMHEKLMSIGDDSWVEDEQGHKAFRIDGKAMRVRDTVVLEDPEGQEVASFQRHPVRVRDTMTVERDGREVARIRKAIISPIRDRFDVDLSSGDHWNVQGNVLAHEYDIDGDAGKVAEVSKKWFRVRDSYGIEVEPGQDDGLVLAVTAAVDDMRRE